MYSFYDYMQMGGMPQMKAGGDPDGQMAMGQIMAMHEKLSALQKFIQPDSDLEPWVASKLTLADDYLNSVAEYMQYNPEENGEMQYEEEGLPEQQMMKGGGYVVTRSSDRKGKTHKVTGPDGTVKYFGDSKLGQHPKDPERKKAFYARHKKNLAGNPHFRAFARKTWEEGGEIDMMGEGGSTFSGNAWYGGGGEYGPGIYAGSEDIDRYQLGRQRVSLAPSMSQDYYGDDTMMNPDDQYIQNMFSMEQPQKMPALNPIPGSIPPQVNYNGKQQAYLSDMYGSGMMTFDNKQQMDLTGQGVNTYAWDSFGQDQNAPGKTAAMKEADRPYQIEQQQAINPIYGDVEKLQSMLNVASRKDLKASVKDFNETYGSDMKVPGSYMGADGQKTLKKINKFSDFLRKNISTASGITDAYNMRKGKREQEWRDRNLGSTSSLYPVVPENMSGNRGDYVVTGSRYGDFRPDEKTVNLGQYTGKFYPQLNMQFGGGILDQELTMPSELIESPVMVAANTETASEPAPAKKSSGSSGANPLANETWNDISSQFQGVTNMGIWGDERHKKRVSDHNTGDALDIGIKAIDQGNQISQKLIDEAKNRDVKYIIFNRQIWNPSVNKWLPYDGDNPHIDHVHVSFNRNNDKPKNSEDLGQISLTHNNPLNIHQGPFASQYGGKKGSVDGSGNVSIFPDMNTGIKAAKDLLFGPNYNNLTISQARNKWVKGNPNEASSSTPHIVKEMGGDKKLSQLTPAEKDALIKQFAKWEGKQAYTKIKDMKLFEDGGSLQYNEGDVYELSEDEIRSILSTGGNVEFL